LTVDRNFKKEVIYHIKELLERQFFKKMPVEYLSRNDKYYKQTSKHNVYNDISDDSHRKFVSAEIEESLEKSSFLKDLKIYATQKQNQTAEEIARDFVYSTKKIAKSKEIVQEVLENRNYSKLGEREVSTGQRMALEELGAEYFRKYLTESYKVIEACLKEQKSIYSQDAMELKELMMISQGYGESHKPDYEKSFHNLTKRQVLQKIKERDILDISSKEFSEEYLKIAEEHSVYKTILRKVEEKKEDIRIAHEEKEIAIAKEKEEIKKAKDKEFMDSLNTEAEPEMMSMYQGMVRAAVKVLKALKIPDISKALKQYTFKKNLNVNKEYLLKTKEKPKRRIRP